MTPAAPSDPKGTAPPRSRRHDRLWRAALVVLAANLVVAGIRLAEDDDAGLVLRRALVDTTTTTTVPTTTTQPPVFPPLAGDAAGTVPTDAGVVAPVLRPADGGGLVVLTPCSNEAVVASREILRGAHVVLDPGHGGSEPGAVGPTGLVESEVNLDVALRAAELLRARGATVVLTREADVRVTLQTRATVALHLQPMAFVSIHHNAAPVGSGDRPGIELYHQAGNQASARLGGLVHEELQSAFAGFAADWAVGPRPGVRSRQSGSGADFYGVLRRSVGVTGVLVEAAFISNPSEEALLRTDEFRQAEAAALAAGVERYVATADPGSGFAPPVVSDTPAGGGGGSVGCVDPAL